MENDTFGFFLIWGDEVGCLFNPGLTTECSCAIIWQTHLICRVLILNIIHVHRIQHAQTYQIRMALLICT